MDREQESFVDPSAALLRLEPLICRAHNLSIIAADFGEGILGDSPFASHEGAEALIFLNNELCEVIRQAKQMLKSSFTQE